MDQDMDISSLTPDKQVKLQYWLDVIRQCRASGMTNQEWCEQNGVSLKSYYYWLAKIRKLALDDLPRKQYVSALPAAQKTSALSEHPATFTELPLPNTAVFDTNAAAILHIGSVTVEIFEHTSSELISSIVKAVQPC